MGWVSCCKRVEASADLGKGWICAAIVVVERSIIWTTLEWRVRWPTKKSREFSVFASWEISLIVLEFIELLKVTKGDVCYKVIPNVPCQGQEIGTKCLPACEKACGLSVLAICINPGPGLGYNCACSIVVPDCSKKRPC
ncbi:hypothetical protein Salat_2861800 [Sesamum alatum]|uniref:Uncharacterized protein n=1 Tax=Sesamum alatum TaxID=300844 RepID=A0AAE1XMB8_9LAMI|nr:hypothetical protein Salat_2861800 [Sesamum alatum]